MTYSHSIKRADAVLALVRREDGLPESTMEIMGKAAAATYGMLASGSEPKGNPPLMAIAADIAVAIDEIDTVLVQYHGKRGVGTGLTDKMRVVQDVLYLALTLTLARAVKKGELPKTPEECGLARMH